MSVYTVDTGAMDVTTGRAKATVERLRAESQTLKAELVQLQSTWSGSASVAFQECGEQWAAAQMQVEQVLESIGTALAAAANQYREADLYTTSLFRHS